LLLIVEPIDWKWRAYNNELLLLLFPITFKFKNATWSIHWIFLCFMFSVLLDAKPKIK
jgi:hypothetical protein